MSEENEDIRTTLLYRNAKAAGDVLNEMQEELQTVVSENKRLSEQVALLNQNVGQLQHQVNVMWVKHMGHGATSDEE